MKKTIADLKQAQEKAQAAALSQRRVIAQLEQDKKDLMAPSIKYILKPQNIETISDMQVPNEFVCPISTELMRNPVATANDRYYEESYIEKWLETSNKDPVTNVALPNKKLKPVLWLSKAIILWLKLTEELETMRKELEVLDVMKFKFKHIVLAAADADQSLFWRNAGANGIKRTCCETCVDPPKWEQFPQQFPNRNGINTQ